METTKSTLREIPEASETFLLPTSIFPKLFLETPDPWTTDQLKREKKTSYLSQSLPQSLKEETSLATQLLGHVVGSRFINGTKHEGASHASSAKLLALLIKDGCQQIDAPLKRRIQNQLAQFQKTLIWISDKNLDRATSKLLSALTSLKPEEGYLIPGGWAGNPGHAMSYQFVRKKGGTFDLYLYEPNVCSYIGANLIEGGQVKGCPLLHFANVPQEKVLFEAFIKELIRPKIDPILNATRVYEIEDILFRFFHLFPYVNSHPPVNFVVKPQGAGICSWKALLNWLRHMIDDVEVYKQVVLEIKLKTLWMGAYDYLSRSETDSEMRAVLENGARRLAWYARNQQNSLAKDACATALDLLDQLTKERKQDEKKVDLRPLEIEKPSQSKNRKDPAQLLKGIKTLSEKNDPCRTNRVSPAPYWTLPTSYHLATNLSDAIEKQIWPNPLLERVFFLEGLANSLPISKDDYWKHLTEKDAKSCLSSLNHLMHAFCLSSRSLNLPLIEFENASRAFVAAAHQLAKRIDKGATDLANFGICLANHDYREDRYQIPFSRQAVEKEAELDAYFEKFKGAKLFDLDQLYPFSILKSSADYTLFSSLLKENAPLKKAMTQWKIPEKFREALIGIENPDSKAICTLALAASFWNSPLATCYPHIHTLQRMAMRHQLHSYRLTYDPREDNDIEVYPLKYNSDFLLQKHYAFTHIFKKAQNYKTFARPLHRAIDPSLEEFISTKEAGQRILFHPQHEEGKALKQASHSADSPFLRELWRLRATKTLSPYELLRLFTEYLPLLAESSYQTLFHLWLLRTTYDQKEAIQLHQTTLSEKEQTLLKEQFDSFFSNAIKHFSEQQPEGKPAFFPSLFLLETEIIVYNYLGIESPPQTNTHLQKWLEEGIFTKEEKGALYLLQVFAKSRQEKTLTEEEHIHALVNWGLFCTSPQQKGLIHPVFHYESERFVHKLLNHTDGTSLKQAATLILKALGIEGKEPKITSKTSVQFIYQQEPIEINLLTGELASKKGRILLNPKGPLKQTSTYKRIFGERTIYSLEMKDQILHFCDSWHGSMRWTQEEAFERLYKGEWLYYINYKKLNDYQIPNALIHDYTHWISTDQSGILYFSSRKNGQMQYLMDRSGSIKEIAKEKREIASASQNTVPAQFDNPGFILYKCQNGQVLSCHFTRYRSLADTPLAFEWVENAFVWTEDRSYRLTQNTLPTLLGTLANTLVLVHKKTGEGRLLVPLRPLTDAKNQVAPSGHLLSEDPLNGEEFEEGRYYFITLSVNKEKIPAPLNTEGICLMSYLALTQGDYGQAIAYIKEITRGTFLSEISLKILHSILTFAQRKTGEAAAVRLFAGLALYRKEKLTDKRVTLEIVLEDYLTHRLRLEKRFLLDEQEEELVLLKICSSKNRLKIRNRHEALKKPLTQPVDLSSTKLEKTYEIKFDFPKSDYFLNNFIHDTITNALFQSYYAEALEGGVKREALFYKLMVKALTGKPELPFNKNALNLLLAASSPERISPCPPLPLSSSTLTEIYEWLDQLATSSPLTVTLPQPTPPELPSQSPNPQPSTVFIKNRVLGKGEDRALLETLYSTYFDRSPQKRAHPSSPYAEALQSADQDKSLQIELQKLEEDLKQGRKLNDEQVVGEPKEKTSLQDFQYQIQKEIDKTRKESDAMWESLLTKARHITYSGKGVELAQPDRRPSIADLRGLFVQQKWTLYNNANVESLYGEVGLSLDKENYLNQLERIDVLLSHLQKNDPPEPRKKLLYKLWEETRARQYDLSNSPQSVIVENIGKISLRKKQTEMLKKMTLLDQKGLPNPFVGHLLMGEGKTDVIASIWLAQMAGTGKLPCLVLPAPLFSPVRDRLGKAQWTRFKQVVDDIEEIAVWHDDQTKEYTIESLQKAYDKLIWLKEHQGALLINHVTLRAMITAFFNTARAFSSHPNASLHKRLQLFADILRLFQEEVVALIDEVNQVLDTHFEVNSPTGEQQQLPFQELELLYHIYSAASEEDLEQKIGFSRNKQSEMSVKTLKEEVVPTLAEKLTSYAPFALNASDHPPFVRYLTGEIDKRVEDLINLCTKEEKKGLTTETDYSRCLDHLEKIATNHSSPLLEDLPFLKTLDEDVNSQDPELVQRVNLISLARGWLRTLFPQISSWETGRRFGRKANGDVGPFAAAGIETTRNFTSPHVAVSCHLQAALYLGIDQKQIAHLGRLFTAAANDAMRKNGGNFKATFEASEFFNLFGIPLHKISEKQALDKAHQNLSGNNRNTLDIASRLAGDRITYWKGYFTSTALGFPKLFAACQGMSGILANACDFTFPLSDATHLDIGTEGRIIDNALENQTYTFTNNQPKEIFKELFNQVAQPENWKGIADAGGLLLDKETSPCKVAKALMEVLIDKGVQPQAILFFQPKEGDRSPEPRRYLHAFEPHANQPKLIGLTTKEAIAAAGYRYQDCFYYWDEYHITGIDLPPIPQSKGWVTAPNLQAYLRYRDFFFGQEIHLACRSSSGLAEQFLAAAQKRVEARCKAQERLYRDRIDAVYDTNVLHTLVKIASDAEAFATFFNHHLPLIERVNPSSTYTAYGKLMIPHKSITSLKNYAEIKKALWKGPLPQAVKEESDEILKRAAQSSYLPKYSSETPGQLSSEVEATHELIQEQSEEVQQENELEQELQSYLTGNIGPPCQEKRKWEVASLIKTLHEGSTPPSVMTLRDFMGEQQAKEKRYHPVFTEKLLGTKDFFYPYDCPISTFHLAFRPAQQILVIKTKNQGLRGVLLTAQEGEYVKKQINNSSFEGAYLIQADGSPLALFPQNLPPEKDELIPLLVEVNVLNGCVRFLERHQIETFRWLQDGASEIKLRYLKLKIYKNPEQQIAFKNSYLFGGLEKNVPTITRARNSEASQKSPDFSSLIGNVATVNPLLIPHLNENQVLQLERIDQIQRLTKKQLDWITPSQVVALNPSQIRHLKDPTLIQKVSESKIKYLSDEGIAQLAPEQIQTIDAPKTVKRLSNDQVKHLIKPSGIQSLTGDQLNHLISSQWPHVKWNQSKSLWAKGHSKEILFVLTFALMASYLNYRLWKSPPFFKPCFQKTWSPRHYVLTN